MTISKASNIISNVALVIGILIVIKIGYDRFSMPGICPISSNGNLMKIGIAMLVVSVALSFVSDYYKKRNK